MSRGNRTARGVMLDMAALATKHEMTRAVGNVPMNARGDRLNEDGTVKVKAEDIAVAHQNTVEPPQQQPISDPKPIEQPAVKPTAPPKAKKSQPAPDPEIPNLEEQFSEEPEAIIALNSSVFCSLVIISAKINFPASCNKAGNKISSFKSTSTLDNQRLVSVEERFEALSREVINQKLANVVTICKKLTQKTDGSSKYVYYCAIEMKAKDIIEAINERITKEETLRIDYDYEKFKETFDKEMEKLEKGL